jgi:hypothetical protein
MFVTNAGSVSALKGQFTSVLLNLPYLGAEVDWSDGAYGVYVVALSVGAAKGLPTSFQVLQTNTFYAKTHSCIQEQH